MSRQRGSIYLEAAEVIAHKALPGDQHILRLHAPRCAATAQPGMFGHLQCHPDLPMRRPLSIMRTDADGAWVEYLYRSVGHGTRRLAQAKPGDRLSHLGPIGRPFVLNPQRPRLLLLGGGVGIPPMVFVADAARRRGGLDPLLLMGSEVPFPFSPRPSEIIVPGIPQGTIAAMPLMEDWGIPSRLTTRRNYPGCYDGFVTDLAQEWLGTLDTAALARVEVLACGPQPMLEAAARLAQRFSLPCQIAVEEYMACGVGGCAGCTIEVSTEQGPAMRRVCVDGPVFDAATVFPP